MDRILIILKKENGPRASSAPVLGLNTIIFKHVYWYMQQTQVSVYRTIGPLVFYPKHRFCVLVRNASPWWFQRVPTAYILSKIKKSTVLLKFLLIKNSVYYMDVLS